MAFSAANGAVTQAWTGATTATLVTFWFKSSASTSNMNLAARSSNLSSASGWNIYFRTTTRILEFNGKSGTTARISFASTRTGLTDGAWHHVLLAIDYGSGTTTSLYLDGVLEASGVSSGTWGGNGSSQYFGTSSDGFWGVYTGYLAECAGASHPGVTADVAAYAAALYAGFTPPRVFGSRMHAYMPGLGVNQNIANSTNSVIQGTVTTVADYPRRIG